MALTGAKLALESAVKISTTEFLALINERLALTTELLALTTELLALASERLALTNERLAPESGVFALRHDKSAHFEDD